MKILSWNVCGIRSVMRKGALAPVLEAGGYDIVALQEVRCDPDGACVVMGDMGYPHVAVNAATKKGYAGTALLSRAPFQRLPDPGLDDEGRLIAADFGDFILITAYVPFSGQKTLDRLPQRMEWDARVAAYVAGLTKPVILCGDLNVARTPMDVHHPERQKRAAGFTPEERTGFETLLATHGGLRDTFREAHPEQIKYSFWSNFAQSRTKNLGWRLDYILASPGLGIAGADILADAVGSDHAPVVAELLDRRPALVAAFGALKASSAATGQAFKAKAYGRVLDQLERMEGPAYAEEPLLARMTGVGASIRAKIDAVFAGRVPAAAVAAVSPRALAIQELTSVTSIGPVKAERLVDQSGVTGVADLRAKVAEGLIALSEAEVLGLHHWEDFLLKIPREEMNLHRATLEAALPQGASLTVMGSYRRGAANSGDIDALVTPPDALPKLAARLTESGYLLPDDFGRGDKKILGIVRLPDAPHHRRLDLLAVTPADVPFALLYFTGSKEYNMRVRAVAKEAGFSMSERGLRPTTDEAAARLAARLAEGGPFAGEADVLAFLGLPFVAPEQRV